MENSYRSTTKPILDLNVVLKEFEKGNKWLEEIRLSELGHLYHEYHDLRARLTNLHQVGNEMLATIYTIDIYI